MSRKLLCVLAASSLMCRSVAHVVLAQDRGRGGGGGGGRPQGQPQRPPPQVQRSAPPQVQRAAPQVHRPQPQAQRPTPQAQRSQSQISRPQPQLSRDPRISKPESRIQKQDPRISRPVPNLEKQKPRIGRPDRPQKPLQGHAGPINKQLPPGNAKKPGDDSGIRSGERLKDHPQFDTPKGRAFAGVPGGPGRLTSPKGSGQSLGFMPKGPVAPSGPPLSAGVFKKPVTIPTSFTTGKPLTRIPGASLTRTNHKPLPAVPKGLLGPGRIEAPRSAPKFTITKAPHQHYHARLYPFVQRHWKKDAVWAFIAGIGYISIPESYYERVYEYCRGGHYDSAIGLLSEAAVEEEMGESYVVRVREPAPVYKYRATSVPVVVEEVQCFLNHFVDRKWNAPFVSVMITLDGEDKNVTVPSEIYDEFIVQVEKPDYVSACKILVEFAARDTAPPLDRNALLQLGVDNSTAYE